MAYLGGAHDGVHGVVHGGVVGVRGGVVEVHSAAEGVQSAVGEVRDVHSSPSARTVQQSQRPGPSRSLVDRLDHEARFLVERTGT